MFLMTNLLPRESYSKPSYERLEYLTLDYSYCGVRYLMHMNLISP